jgi:hypothetical protein
VRQSSIIGGLELKNSYNGLRQTQQQQLTPPEEILTAKEVALDSGASTSWVYAHADVGGYCVGRRIWFHWQRI